MSSVLEMKAQLADQQEHAAKLAEKALQAIEATTTVGNFWLTFLGIELGVLAVIGLAVVFLWTKRQARQVAESRIRAYIASAEGATVVRGAIADEVALQLERRSFVVVHPQHSEPNEPKFPTDPKKEAGR